MNDVMVANPFGGDAAQAAAGALISVEQQKAIAEVQAALVMARVHPRDPRRAMDLILQDCMRPTLAEEATYQYARGGSDISGPSIRLAETIARRWGNIESGVKELTRRDGVSECLAYAWDLQSNYRDVRTFNVRHWRDTKKGGYALTDERDIYESVANAGARRKRACILALIDGDVVEAAVKQCEATLETKVAVDEAFIAQMLARFAAHGVSQEMIEKRIQRHVSSLTPALAVSLRKIYNSLRDGMSTPSEWFEVAPPAGDVANAPPHGSRTEAVRESLKARRPRARAAKAEEVVTYAMVADELNQAQDKAALDLVATRIQEVEDTAQRTELETLYSQLAAQLGEQEE
ncbi:hypothetical protein AAB992_14150 [Burkholderia contaminans]|uniref:hypothetical protein n=1 Tax=Burkholderia contaminans TaxID=488447 RepID=UPI002415EBCF|nr:hypothetical protein [Burkholderia contaminans]WFN14384.1 hypothetical protein LXE92_36365 [Burkholderia contaminans]